jgi:hypothetical protein
MTLYASDQRVTRMNSVQMRTMKHCPEPVEAQTSHPFIVQ